MRKIELDCPICGEGVRIPLPETEHTRDDAGPFLRFSCPSCGQQRAPLTQEQSDYLDAVGLPLNFPTMVEEPLTLHEVEALVEQLRVEDIWSLFESDSESGR